jgi:hypothetical protein
MTKRQRTAALQNARRPHFFGLPWQNIDDRRKTASSPEITMRCILRWTIVLSWLLMSQETSFAVDQTSKSGPQLGIQTWTLRTLNFDQALEFAATHGNL